jgi:hypothetical protein
MTGHVFHPGHEELHGITVLVDGKSGRAYVGRYHETGPRGVVLHDVAVREPDAVLGRTEWIARQHKFGVQASHKHLIVPADEVAAIVRFVETA